MGRGRPAHGPFIQPESLGSLHLLEPSFQRLNPAFISLANFIDVLTNGFDR